VSIYLPLLWGSKPWKTLVYYGGKAESKKWRAFCPRDNPLYQIFLRSGQLSGPYGPLQN
jgi:hypothetical protein